MMRTLQLSLATIAIVILALSFNLPRNQSHIFDMLGVMVVMIGLLTLPNQNRFVYFVAGVALVLQLVALAMLLGILKFANMC
jgi:hypothetical protein